MIFAAFVRIHHKRDESRAVLLYLVIANFIACTVYLAVDITAYQTNALGWILGSNTLYTCVDFISQVILVNFSYIEFRPTTEVRRFSFSIKIYRCWMMWRQPWVMVAPILLTLTFLGASASLHNSNRNI